MRDIIIALLSLCISFVVLTAGVFVGEVKATHYLQHEATATAKRQEDAWLKWQRDQIDQYQREHPGSHPETKDFRG